MKAVITMLLVLGTMGLEAQNRKPKKPSDGNDLSRAAGQRPPGANLRYDSLSPKIKQPASNQNSKTQKPSARSGTVSGEKLDDLKNPFDTSKVKLVKQQVTQTNNGSSERTKQQNANQPGNTPGNMSNTRRKRKGGTK
jgi:hypothetical protein